MLLKGNLITVRVQLDLWYNFIRRPLTTVSVTIFLYFNSEEATKKVAQCKKKSQKLNFFVKLSYLAQKLNSEPFCFLINFVRMKREHSM